ncbi:MAG TPA: hypothetical protein VGY48_17640, partial [Vicinamibacterales bacterium]|nr:hypothetical protein [Vicinamibacterales bacterium]
TSPDGQGFCCPPSQTHDNCDPSFNEGGFSPSSTCSPPPLNLGDVQRMYSLQSDPHGCSYWMLVCDLSPQRVCGVAYDGGPSSCPDGGTADASD